MKQEQIARINELYRRQKAGLLTPEEREEQSVLRAQYVAEIRNGVDLAVRKMVEEHK